MKWLESVLFTPREMKMKIDYSTLDNTLTAGNIDLHNHSTCSDGTCTPTELFEIAKALKLKAFALTDHDTVAGIDEVLLAGKDSDIIIIPGIELSTQYRKKELHIVGLFINPGDEKLQSHVSRFVTERDERNRKMCAKFQELGIPLSYEILTAQNPGAVITRAHYANFLLENGYVASRKEAFDKYLDSTAPCYVPRNKTSPFEAINLIRQAGGIAILAHPTLYHMTDDELEDTVGLLKKAGLAGIEVKYSTYDSEQEQKITALCEKYELLKSGGSDFHGNSKPGLFMGYGYGKLAIPYDYLKAMEKYMDNNKTNKQKIFFTDLDGTLLNDVKDVTPKTREALSDWTKAGHAFVLSSGRDIQSVIHDVKEKLELNYGNMYLEGFNGGVIYDCGKKEIIHSEYMTRKDVEAIIKAGKEAGLYVQTYTVDNILSPGEGESLSYYQRVIKTPVVFFDSMPDEKFQDVFCKCLCIELHDHEKLEAFRIKMQELIGDRISILYSNPSYLEFFPKSSGKGAGLKKLCELINIPIENSLAAGDEQNDVSMLEAAGVGIAMLNGSDEIKKAASVVTKTDNNNDGLAPVLQSLL